MSTQNAAHLCVRLSSGWVFIRVGQRVRQMDSISCFYCKTDIITKAGQKLTWLIRQVSHCVIVQLDHAGFMSTCPVALQQTITFISNYCL